MTTFDTRRPADLADKQPARIAVIERLPNRPDSSNHSERIVLRVAAAAFLLVAAFMAYCATTGYRL